ncbi:MAG: 30S ribosomal protein S6 [Planctomycetales bacterium]|nr:30S ribosomal protein S6 [Planctomycetales bacterium]
MPATCYDCFFLFDSNKYNRDPGGVIAAAHKSIEDLGGEILASRLWEERKLAYPIDGHAKGTYWITYFKMDGPNLPAFNRACQLNESIMRSLVTKVDPRLVDTLVAHTLGHTDASSVAREEGERVAVAVGADDDESEEEE